MNTYFIRHTEDLWVDNETRDRLWNDKIIAIHFPRSKDDAADSLPLVDFESLNPSDYRKEDAKSIRAMTNLAKDGGYVCAEYFGQQGCLIGKVEPATSIVIDKQGFWHTPPDRPATLSTLQLLEWKILPPEQYALLRAVRPARGTIRRWRAIDSVVKDMVTGTRA